MTSNPNHESRLVHPRVAALLKHADWLYVHECVLDDNTRIDFVALNPRSGHVAIVECKVRVVSVSDLVSQVNHYHTGFGMPQAFKWVFNHSTPIHSTTLRLMTHDIQIFPMADEPAIDPIDPHVGHKATRIFWETFQRFHPDICKSWGWN